MNVYLIPYNTSRHFVMALYIGGAALLSWWVSLLVIVGLGPTFHSMGMWWSQGAEGIAMLAFASTVIATASMAAEGGLRRRKLQYRLLYAGLAGMSTMAGFVAFALLYQGMKPFLGGSGMKEILSDGSLVTLRFRLALWGFAGLASGMGPWWVRRTQTGIARRFGWGVDGLAPPRAPTWGQWALDVFHHAAGGVTAALIGAAIWHLLGHYKWAAANLYLGPGLGIFAWGVVHGLLVWGIPDDLYAGWVRVLSAERYGLRIPIPRLDGTAAERFVGHFPRGLDLFLPGEQGVAELHLSVVVDPDHRYAVRGLSVQPTVVKRFLERIDLRYDPRRPAPLETELAMEDRILLGPNNETVIEFILLPKEER